MGKVRDMFGGMGRFKGWLMCKGWVNSVNKNVITVVINAVIYFFVIFFLCAM